MSKMSSKENISTRSPHTAGRGEKGFSPPAILCRSQLGREGTSPRHRASSTRMMPNKAGRYGQTDGGRMRDREARVHRCLQTGNYRQFYISARWPQRPPAALTGMNGRAVRPGWDQGQGWVTADAATEQGKRQLQAAGVGDSHAGWVSPGGRCVLTQEKGPLCCR